MWLMVKLQITLTDEEAGLLSKKAQGLGYGVAKYAKFILAKEAQDSLQSVPVYKATPRAQKLVSQAIKENRVGLTTPWEFDDAN